VPIEASALTYPDRKIPRWEKFLEEQQQLLSVDVTSLDGLGRLAWHNGLGKGATPETAEKVSFD
jgi:hypothetical protein